MSVYCNGQRIQIRDEEFIIISAKNTPAGQMLEVEGLSELVRNHRFHFEVAAEGPIEQVDPLSVRLVPDISAGAIDSRLYLESLRRRQSSSLEDKRVLLSDRCAFTQQDYQYVPLAKALRLPRQRLLLADAVGLGKTIEVGILLTELAKRGRAERVLVLALKSVLAQFQQELWHRFSFPLIRIDSQSIAQIVSSIPKNKNPFDHLDRTIISIDTLKDSNFNLNLEKSHWDVIVIDECHLVTNLSSERGKLAHLLAQRCDTLILTSATPHNGKNNSFANLIRMIEPSLVPPKGAIEGRKVKDYYVRRFKKDLGKGQELQNFQQRQSVQVAIAPHELERQALRSLRALAEWAGATLGDKSGARRREKAISGPLLFAFGLLKAFLSSPEAALKSLNERLGKARKPDDSFGPEVDQRLEELRQLARELVDRHIDSRYDALLRLLAQLGWTSAPDSPRVVLFTERVETLNALKNKLEKHFKLEERQEVVQAFDGSLADTEQTRIVEAFGKGDAPIRLLLATDAASQGVNLHHHCHLMVNYDLPWSIITVAQRNGRIDRYGQKQVPVIYNFVALTNDPAALDDKFVGEKLLQKEEEVVNTLGDPALLMALFDAKLEEKALELSAAQAIEHHSDSIELPTPQEAAQVLDDDDGWDFDEQILPSEADEQAPAALAEIVPEGLVREKAPSWFASDAEFFAEAVRSMRKHGENRWKNKDNDTQVEVEWDPELDELFAHMPKEARPNLSAPGGARLSLTTRPDYILRAIERSRNQKGWADMQLLHEEHPVGRFMLTKLEAQRLRDQVSCFAFRDAGGKLPQGALLYLFVGQSLNSAGQNVIIESHVVELDRQSLCLRRQFPLESLLADLPAQPITEGLAESELPHAHEGIGIALEALQQQWGELTAQVKTSLEDRIQRYKNLVNDWEAAIRQELEAEKHTPHLARKRRELQTQTAFVDKTIASQKALDSDSFFRLLAVMAT